MTLNVPGIGEVPVVWKPSDLVGPDSDGHVGRFTSYAKTKAQVIRAIVHHRVVGSLESMTNNTFYPTTDNVLQAGERRVSSNFGIGFWGTELRIVQYVAVENTAYCNGQNDRDRAACTWQLWIDAGRPEPNGMTVSIEHEDNASIDGGDGTYVVAPGIIAASIALDRLLLGGNGPAIRAAGIRCNDTAAAQLGRITPSVQTLVDHKTVCPITKPYCWRAYGDDLGFPQARYVTELTAAPAPTPPTPEDDMGLTITLPPSPIAGAVTIPVGTDAERVSDGVHYKVPLAVNRPGYAVSLATVPGYLVDLNDDVAHFVRAEAVTFRAITVDCGPAVKAATDPLNARIEGMKLKTANFAGDIAND